MPLTYGRLIQEKPRLEKEEGARDKKKQVKRTRKGRQEEIKRCTDV